MLRQVNGLSLPPLLPSFFARVSSPLPKEDVVYGVFIECVILHKQPNYRFAVYPQLRLKWKPEDRRDRRSEIPDIGLGVFTGPGYHPPFRLRCGVEAKRAVKLMESLPSPDSIMNDDLVIAAFNSLYYQAQDQAKAACKGGYPLSNDSIQWILLVGPYWTPETFGPFSESELGIRAHKESHCGDFGATVALAAEMDGPPRNLQELYLLGTRESYERFEQILESTDELAYDLLEAFSYFLLKYS